MSNQEVTRRLERAIGIDDEGSFGVVAPLLWYVALASAAATLEDVSWLPFLFLAIVVAVATTCAWYATDDAAAKRREVAVATELAWANTHPFSITGYRDWLVGRIPVMRIELRTAINADTFVHEVTTIDPRIATIVVDASTYSLVMPRDMRLLKTVFARLLVPVHADAGIARIAMGAWMR